MYAFFPFPAAVKAMTSRRHACRASIDGSSRSISVLARVAYSSLNLTAAWYPFGCGVYLALRIKIKSTGSRVDLTLPRSHRIDSVDQECGKLIQLKTLPNGGLIKDKEGLGMEPGKVRVEECVGLDARR